MVYSTCSLHPVEDEAVMARILQVGAWLLKTAYSWTISRVQECGDSVRLVEIAPKLPGLGYTRYNSLDGDMD